MQCKIVRSIDPQLVEKEVIQLLQEGWKLHGNLVVVKGASSHHYYREMVPESRGVDSGAVSNRSPRRLDSGRDYADWPSTRFCCSLIRSSNVPG